MECCRGTVFRPSGGRDVRGRSVRLLQTPSARNQSQKVQCRSVDWCGDGGGDVLAVDRPCCSCAGYVEHRRGYKRSVQYAFFAPVKPEEETMVEHYLVVQNNLLAMILLPLMLLGAGGLTALFALVLEEFERRWFSASSE